MQLRSSTMKMLVVAIESYCPSTDSPSDLRRTPHNQKHPQLHPPKSIVPWFAFVALPAGEASHLVANLVGRRLHLLLRRLI